MGSGGRLKMLPKQTNSQNARTHTSIFTSWKGRHENNNNNCKMKPFEQLSFIFTSAEWCRWPYQHNSIDFAGLQQLLQLRGKNQIYNCGSIMIIEKGHFENTWYTAAQRAPAICMPALHRLQQGRDFQPPRSRHPFSAALALINSASARHWKVGPIK